MTVILQPETEKIPWTAGTREVTWKSQLAATLNRES